MSEFKFKVGDQVLWGGWSCLVNYAGSLPMYEKGDSDVYIIQQMGGKLRAIVHGKDAIEATAMLEYEKGFKGLKSITKNGTWPPDCWPEPEPCGKP